jgi:transcriptional regulator with XRE-family HTH domain
MSGLSRKEVGDKSKVPASRMSEWINGKKEIQFESLKKIAESIGFTIEVHILNASGKENSTIDNKPEVIGVTIKPTEYRCGCKVQGALFVRSKTCKVPRVDHDTTS